MCFHQLDFSHHGLRFPVDFFYVITNQLNMLETFQHFTGAKLYAVKITMLANLLILPRPDKFLFLQFLKHSLIIEYIGIVVVELS